MSTSDKIVTINNKSYEDIKEESIRRRLLLRKIQPKIKQEIKKHMTQVMQGMFDSADDTLFKLAESASEGADKNLYFDSMRVVRLQRQTIEKTFFNEVDLYFDNFEQNSEHSDHNLDLQDFSLDSMSLLSEDDLEIDLATNNLIQKIRNQYAPELNALDKRLAHLLNQSDDDVRSGSFAVDIIVRSFVKATAAIQLTLEVQLIVMKLFDLHCVKNLAEMYYTINKIFIDENILPVIKSEVIKKSNSGQQRRENQIIEGIGSELSAHMHDAAQMQVPIWSQLQQLVNYQKQNRGLSGTTMPQGSTKDQDADSGLIHGSYLGMSTSDVVAVLTDIQSMGFDEVPNSGAYAVGNFLRVQLQQDKQRPLNPVDNDLIDIVCLIFEYILEDPHLPAAARVSIARLQIPMLKVAMLDKAFFSINGHPARNLLNLLASTAVGIDDTEGRRHPILNKINEIVDMVLERFTDDMSLFDDLTDELKAFIAENKSDEKNICDDISRVQHEKEELALARAWVKETLSQHVLGRALPKPVADIILGAWKEVMLQTYLQQGEHSQLWKTQIRLIDVLCWSVEPKRHKLDRTKLATIISQLIRTLRDGFKLINMPQHELNTILNTLEPYHLASVHGPDLEQRKLADKANKKATSDLTDITDIGVFDATSDSGIGQDHVLLDEIVLSDWEPASDLNQIDDEYLQLARHLEMGKWLEFKNEKGEMRRARLAWKSDLLGEFTFLNWKFDVVADKSLHELADDLRKGHARVVNDVPLMDRALSAVVNSLLPKSG